MPSHCYKNKLNASNSITNVTYTYGFYQQYQKKHFIFHISIVPFPSCIYKTLLWFTVYKLSFVNSILIIICKSLLIPYPPVLMTIIMVVAGRPMMDQTLLFQALYQHRIEKQFLNQKIEHCRKLGFHNQAHAQE